MTDIPGAPLRPPGVVMSLARAGCVVPDALSFARSAMRELVRARWRIQKVRFDLDAEGRGEVLYRLLGAGWMFHFFLVSQKLPEAQKTDRNFAASWDAMGVLCQGEWTAAREARLRREVPKQRAGYADYDTLVYARGNRSARLFDQVVDSLAAGRQPDPRAIAPVGYILRTTAFIGNGQLGTRPLAGFEPDHPLRRPYHAQFCSAFALREYVFDLVDHMARARHPRAARLSPAFRRYLGLGNAAATGLVAFVANHPHFMHRWCVAHETALARALDREAAAGDAATRRYAGLLDKAIRHHEEGAREDDGVFAAPQVVAAELRRLVPLVDEFRSRGTVDGRPAPRPWAALGAWCARHLHPEAAEVANAIAIELYPDIVEAAADAFHVEERFDLQPEASAASLGATLRRGYAWALQGGMGAEARHFWYRTVRTPRDVRRGLRGRHEPFEAETAMDTVLQVRQLHECLQGCDPAEPVAGIVCRRPDLRHIVARVQSLAALPYAELRADWLAADFSPFAPVRFPLAFFGMEKFEAARPKSVRGTFMQGAPIAEDVEAGAAGDWPFALMPGAGDEEPRALAPLPESAPHDPGPLPPDDAPDVVWRIAPRELARMVQTALQGHGAELGVAEEAGALVMHAQAASARAVVRTLEHCGDGLVRPSRSVVVGCRDGLACLDAPGASALIAAPAALDLACAAARAAPSGVGAALVAGAEGASLVRALALRCAQRGLAGLLLWSDGGERPHAGFALAAAGSQGPWRAEGDRADGFALHAGTAGDVRAALRPIEAALGGPPCAVAARLAAAVARVVDTPPSQPSWRPGFLLLCLRLPATATADALQAAFGLRCAQARLWSAADVQDEEVRRQRQGLALARRDFEGLTRAGTALLVPDAQEHRVLEPGVDALKVF